MLSLTPFLLFEGDCAEAMAFYRSCLGGDLTVVRVGDTPMKDQRPAELHGLVAYARLVSAAVVLSATDWQHQARRPRQGNTVGLYLTGETAEEMRPVFDRLSAGGDPELLDPLVDMPFGLYGHFADRFGVHWFFRGEPHAGSA